MLVSSLARNRVPDWVIPPVYVLHASYVEQWVVVGMAWGTVGDKEMDVEVSIGSPVNTGAAPLLLARSSETVSHG